jgi:hypothetical protein
MKGITMNNDKSSIDSFSVSFGPTPSKASTAPLEHYQPWNILVCSDFGFKSIQPRQVRVAEWNEFMASERITVSGTVENILAPSASPLFVEYDVASMKDFSPSAMKTNIAAFAGYSAFLDTLATFLDGGCGREVVVASLQKAALPTQENERLLIMLGAHGNRANSQPRPRGVADKPAMASILSMVDMSAPEENRPDTQAPHLALGGLLQTISGGETTGVDKPSCVAYLDAGRKSLAAQLAALQSRPFLALKKASWESLLQCARAIGRKKEITLSVFSAAMDDRDEVLKKLTIEYESSNASWNIILWDYPVSFTNAEMDRLTGLVTAADRFKSVVIAPLDQTDRLFETIDAMDDFSPVFQDIRFLPFKKLRSTLESRALCLCAPDMEVTDGAAAKQVPTTSFIVHCCWPMIVRWIEVTIGDLDPFAVGSAINAMETSMPQGVSFRPAISQSICDEAASVAGLFLYNGKPADMTIDRARTVIDPQIAGTPYSSLAFNLLVNRVARLAGHCIIENATSLGKDEMSRAIEGFLRKELIACRVCTEPDQVSVKPENDGTLLISLNSDVTIGGHPARFSFSLEL